MKKQFSIIICLNSKIIFFCKKRLLLKTPHCNRDAPKKKLWKYIILVWDFIHTIAISCNKNTMICIKCRLGNIPQFIKKHFVYPHASANNMNMNAFFRLIKILDININVYMYICHKIHMNLYMQMYFSKSALFCLVGTNKIQMYMNTSKYIIIKLYQIIKTIWKIVEYLNFRGSPKNCYLHI